MNSYNPDHHNRRSDGRFSAKPQSAAAISLAQPDRPTPEAVPGPSHLRCWSVVSETENAVFHVIESGLTIDRAMEIRDWLGGSGLPQTYSVEPDERADKLAAPE